MNQSNMTKSALLDHFSKFGQVRLEYFPNFAFITFENEQNLDNAFKEDHIIFDGEHNTNCDFTDAECREHRHLVTIRRFEVRPKPFYPVGVRRWDCSMEGHRWDYRY